MRMPIAPLAIFTLLASLCGQSAPAEAQLAVSSPDGRTVVTVETRDGGLYYRVDHDGHPLLLPSRLGFEFRGAPPLWDSLRVSDSARDSVDETCTSEASSR